MDTLVYILFAIIIIMFVIYGHSTTTPEQKEVYLVRQMYWPWWTSSFGYDYYSRPYPRHIPYYRHRMLDPRPLPHTPPPSPPSPPTPIITQPVTPPTNPV